MRRHGGGFTLIELLIVMAIMATLLSIATPRYLASVDRAKEASLKTSLRVMREALDQYRADTGQFPESLARLVEGKYLRAIPIDPMTDTASTWVGVPHPDGQTTGVYDVRSGAAGAGTEGSTFASW